jgi:hypothetical protein
VQALFKAQKEPLVEDAQIRPFVRDATVLPHLALGALTDRLAVAFATDSQGFGPHVGIGRNAAAKNAKPMHTNAVRCVKVSHDEPANARIAVTANTMIASSKNRSFITSLSLAFLGLENESMLALGVLVLMLLFANP